MNRCLAAALIVAGALLLQSSLLPAQTYSTPLPTVNDNDVALLRKNLREAKQLITKNMRRARRRAAHRFDRYLASGKAF